jgi:Zn-dependent peptidase ImmA (M78 family)/DNA-binding XRE family transcriptional regulator
MAVIQTFGMRLREARQGAGLTTRELAQRLKDSGHAISHVTVSKYERNEFSPSAETVKIIASVLGREVEWFDGTEAVLSGIRFRALKTIPVKSKSEFSARALPWLRLYLHLNVLLQRAAPQSLQIRLRADDEPAAAAKKIRDKYKLLNYPIPSVSRMLENAGIRVVRIKGVLGIDGFAATLGNVHVVAVNADLPPDRMRLTLAHELGHVLYEDVAHDREVDHDDLESRAFELASHLLMPSAVLAEAFEIKSMVRLVQYKERFGISLSAMVYRATREELIPQSMAQMLWREFSRLGWRKNEPGRVPADHPVRLETLIDSALRQKKATLTELARIAGVDSDEIQRRVMDAMGAMELTTDDTDAPSFKISAYSERRGRTETTHESE